MNATSFQDYPSDNMSDSQQRFLQHLREIGLVFQRKVQKVWNTVFYVRSKNVRK